MLSANAPRLEVAAFWGDTLLDLVGEVDDLVRAGFVAEPMSEFEAREVATTNGRVSVSRSGEVDLFFRLVSSPRLELSPWTERLNYAWLNSLVFAFFAHLFLISAALTKPLDASEDTDELLRRPFRPIEVRFVPQENNGTGLLRRIKVEGSAGPERGSEGRSGRRSRPPSLVPKLSAEHVLKLLLGPESRAVLASNLTSDLILERALEGVHGTELQANAGDPLGLGIRGDGPGAGGLAMRSVGLGPIGDLGPRAGHLGEGSRVARMAAKSDNDITLTTGTPIIIGALDKVLIRRVIDENRAQIRYCYELALMSEPGLFGKLAMVWTIRADGSVDGVRAEQNTLGSESIERCVETKIRGWKFPKPRGGGVVVVNYPFVFKPAG